MPNPIQHGTDNDTNIVVRMTYDKGGRMRSLRDPNGNLTQYDYDQLGRRTKRTDPAGNVWETAHTHLSDGRTRVTETYPGVNAAGASSYNVTRTMDRMGRVSEINYGDAISTPSVTFEYDPLSGKRVWMTENDGTTDIRLTNYRYDAAHRTTQVNVDTNGNGGMDEVMRYAYDVAGRRTQMVLPGNLRVDYTYDAQGRLKSMTSWDDQVAEFDYDGAGRHTKTERKLSPTAAPDLISTYAYDLAGRLTNLKHEDDQSTVLAEFAFEVDNRGNRTQVSERIKPVGGGANEEKTLVYDYDALARLVSGEVRSGFEAPLGTLEKTFSYAYDTAGNRTQAVENINGGATNTSAYAYTAANQIDTMTVNGGTPVTFTYDPNGNLIADGSNTYIWDRANRLKSLSGTVITTNYRYDGNGNRVWQSTADGLPDVMTYVNDVQGGLSRVLMETRNGISRNYYLHGPRGIHAQIGALINTSTKWGSVTWGQFNLGGVTFDAAGWQHPLTDGLGSVRSVVDASQTVLETRRYTPYGTLDTSTGTPQTDFGFTGEWTDENDLLYLRARYYAPGMGTFTALDPFEGSASRPMSLNGYLYVEGNVPNAVDPTGKQTEAVGAACLAFIVGDGPFPFGDAACAALVTGTVLTLGAISVYNSLRLANTLNGGVCTPDLGIGGRVVAPPNTYPGFNEFENITPVPIQTPPPSQTPEPTGTLPPFPYNQQQTPQPGNTPSITTQPGTATPVPTQPAPTATNQGCNRTNFINWWFSLNTVPQSYRPGEPWYDYEQRVARGGGAYGDYTRHVPQGPIDADGIEPNMCHLVDAKYAINPRQPQYRLDGPPWMDEETDDVSQIVDELRRYKSAIDNSDPVGLTIRTNAQRSVAFFEQRLQDAGFVLNADGFVEVIP